MNAPVKSIVSYESIDQMSEHLNARLEITREDIGLSLEEEFRGHCSNLQAWVEHDYDTRLLHRNLAFPLLKQLTSANDSKAKRKFKSEIIKRYKSGSPTVQLFLVLEDYLSFLERSVLGELISLVIDKQVLKTLSGYLNRKNDDNNHVKTLNRLLWINPIDREAYLVLAYIYIKTHQIAKAKFALNEVLQMYPDDEECTLFLAYCHKFEGKVEKTKNLVEKLDLSLADLLNHKEFVASKSHCYSSLISKFRPTRRHYRPVAYLNLP